MCICNYWQYTRKTISTGYVDYEKYFSLFNIFLKKLNKSRKFMY